MANFTTPSHENRAPQRHPQNTQGNEYVGHIGGDDNGGASSMASSIDDSFINAIHMNDGSCSDRSSDVHSLARLMNQHLLDLEHSFGSLNFTHDSFYGTPRHMVQGGFLPPQHQTLWSPQDRVLAWLSENTDSPAMFEVCHDHGISTPPYFRSGPSSLQSSTGLSSMRAHRSGFSASTQDTSLENSIMLSHKYETTEGNGPVPPRNRIWTNPPHINSRVGPVDGTNWLVLTPDIHIPMGE